MARASWFEEELRGSMNEVLNKRPHRRYNPLRRSWLLVSPQRTSRPWQGETNKEKPAAGAAFDPGCYLCPGNTRTSGVVNPEYKNVYAFTNDFPALNLDPLPEGFVDTPESGSRLMRSEPESGTARVLCFHPNHSLSLARMEVDDLALVVDAWAEETALLGANSAINYVQIFENRGAMMGSSLPHPHCQIWATEHIPDEPKLEGESQLEYLDAHKSCLLCDYLAEELKLDERVVCQNDSFAAVVPFWAVWPFETLILSKAHAGVLPEFSAKQRHDLASLLIRLTTRYDNLFATSFPYTMGLHQSPTDGKDHPEWHFHAHFYPPLLRSAEIKKFMVGFELLGMPQRDITPETAAERLKALSEVHY
jgi:UDPglucose--hexose-1-phosphate uridylyltransferase